MANSCPLDKSKDVSNKQCYGLSASTKKKFKNTEVFTKKITFEIEIVVSTRPV